MAKSGWAGNVNYMNRGAAPGGVTGPPMTLACFYQPIATTSDGTPIALILTNQNNTYDLQVPASTKVLLAETGASGSWVSSASAGTLSNGVWYHLAGVFASTSSRQAFLNGVAATIETTLKAPAGMTDCFIGSSTLNVNVCNGIVAFFGLWNAALTATEIGSLAAGAHPRKIRPSALVVCLNLTGGTTPQPDLVSSGTWAVTGTLTEQPNPRIYR